MKCLSMSCDSIAQYVFQSLSMTCFTNFFVVGIQSHQPSVTTSLLFGGFCISIYLASSVSSCCSYFACSLIWIVVCTKVNHLSFSFFFFFTEEWFSWWRSHHLCAGTKFVAIGEGFDLNNLYVVCEAMVLYSFPHQSIVALLSSFYVFKIVYIKAAKPYCLF